MVGVFLACLPENYWKTRACETKRGPARAARTRVDDAVNDNLAVFISGALC